MQNRWVLIIMGFLLAVAAVLPARAEQWSDAEIQASGTWYGEFTPGVNKPLQRFITTRGPDGAFSVHARLYENGKVIADLKNQGLWGVSNGMYFTVTTEVNGRKTDARVPEVINAYLVQKLGSNEFEYVHVASGNRFRVVRVEAATARLPD